MTQIGGDDVRFQPTSWSIVAQAVQPGPDSREALSLLVERYWKPVYFYIRRRGEDVEAAKDLTQGFFTRLVERGGLERVDRDKGRFRSYLLGAVNFYLAQQAERARAEKRGGGRPLLSLDFDGAEAGYSSGLSAEPADDETPERVYVRAWAREVLDGALERLRQRLDEEGKPAYYEVLLASLDPVGPSYSEIAERLDLSVGDVTNYLHRARKRYRQALLAEILPSVGSLADAEEELHELVGLLRPEEK